MNLSAPKQITWIVAALIGLAGIAVNQGMFSIGSLSAFSLVTIAFLILAIATWIKGL